MKAHLKIAVVCNSDSLAIPSISFLVQNKSLEGVIILKKSSHFLVPLLLNVGVKLRDILELEKERWKESMADWLTRRMIDKVYVFGFPWKISSSITSIPKLGFLNFHYGSLPKYAGADPIFWQLRNGERNLELSVHQMTEQVDNGPLIFVKQFQIIPGENHSILCYRLGIETVKELNKISIFSSNSQHFQDETSVESNYYKKPSISDLTILWNSQGSKEIENLVNAANPRYGGAITFLGNKEFRVLEVSPVDMNDQSICTPGEVIYADNLYGLVISCMDNKFLRIGVAHLSEGYFSGAKLFNIGIKKGIIFTSN